MSPIAVPLAVLLFCMPLHCLSARVQPEFSQHKIAVDRDEDPDIIRRIPGLDGETRSNHRVSCNEPSLQSWLHCGFHSKDTASKVGLDRLMPVRTIAPHKTIVRFRVDTSVSRIQGSRASIVSAFNFLMCRCV
jgi:hypothetical protein